MKEYWVNVYSDNYYNLNRKWFQKPSHKHTSYGKVGYRLHVREFDTREAKELYLEMKYGRLATIYPYVFGQSYSPRELVLRKITALKE